MARIDDIIPRINELAAIAKERELTVEEADERKVLREEYVMLFRQGLEQQILNVKVVNEKGDDITPQKVKDIKNNKK